MYVMLKYVQQHSPKFITVMMAGSRNEKSYL